MTEREKLVRKITFRSEENELELLRKLSTESLYQLRKRVIIILNAEIQ